eukprot:2315418-Rhodomonas_salina.3
MHSNPTVVSLRLLCSAGSQSTGTIAVTAARDVKHEKGDAAKPRGIAVAVQLEHLRTPYRDSEVREVVRMLGPRVLL